jgi:hypothetical protein
MSTPLTSAKAARKRAEPVHFPKLDRQPAPLLAHSERQKNRPSGVPPQGFQRPLKPFGFEKRFWKEVGSNFQNVGALMNRTPPIGDQMRCVAQGRHHQNASTQPRRKFRIWHF